MKILIFILALFPALASADAQQDRINAECIKAIGKPCKIETREKTQSDINYENHVNDINKLIAEIETNRRESERTGRITNQLINIQNQNQLIIRKMYAK
jgi:hypothetical protein